MTTTEPEVQPGAGARHGLRIFLIWIVLALAADLIIWFVWQPHLPPGDMSDAARHQQFDIAVRQVGLPDEPDDQVGGERQDDPDQEDPQAMTGARARLDLGFRRRHDVTTSISPIM